MSNTDLLSPSALFSSLTLQSRAYLSSLSLPLISLLPPTPPPLSPVSTQPPQPSPAPRPSPPAGAGEEGESEVYRPLEPNEARQITLLLTQHFYPVRQSNKGLMRESIALAEMFHDIGLRWDRSRRVMGLHLRGIWEAGSSGDGPLVRLGGGTMDLYIQGSFLSIAEVPHPLDPMPLPLPVRPGSFAALPRVTLSTSMNIGSSLGQVLPGAGVVGGQQDCNGNKSLSGDGQVTDASQDQNQLNENKCAEWASLGQRGWGTRGKKANLRINTDHRKHSQIKLIQPYSAVSMMSMSELKWTRLRKMRYRLLKRVGAVPRTARKINFGGWEVR